MNTVKASLLLAAALAFAAAPFFVTSFAGFDPALFPVPQVDPPVQPAGYAFAIWGLLYLWLILHAGFGLAKRRADPGWDAPRLPLLASLGIGIFWLHTATLSPIWATVQIFVMLGFALWALARTPAKEPWLLGAPIALYAGWLTAASFAGLGITGAGFGLWMGGYGWAVACILGALALGLAVMIALLPNPGYALALAWALVAIMVSNLGSNLDIALLAGAGALVTLAATLRSYTRPRGARRAG